MARYRNKKNLNNGVKYKNMVYSLYVGSTDCAANIFVLGGQVAHVVSKLGVYAKKPKACPRRPYLKSDCSNRTVYFFIVYFLIFNLNAYYSRSPTPFLISTAAVVNNPSNITVMMIKSLVTLSPVPSMTCLSACTI